MEINPDIQETIDYLHRADFEKYRLEHQKAHVCRVGNGEKKDMQLNEAIGTVFDRIEIIEGAVEPLIDLNYIYKRLKKYRKTRYSATLLSVGLMVWKVFF